MLVAVGQTPRLKKHLHALIAGAKRFVHAVLVAFAEQLNNLMHFRLDDKQTIEPHLRTFAELQSWMRRSTPVAGQTNSRL